MAENAGELHLKLEPADKVFFKGKELTEEPSLVKLKITNTTKRQACEVKYTSIEMFRIRSSVVALKSAESNVVQVTFKDSSVPENGKHYFAVYHIKSDHDKKAPRQVWVDHKGQPDGTKRLTIDFDKEHDANKPDDKKVENNKGVDYEECYEDVLLVIIVKPRSLIVLGSRSSAD